MPNQAHFLRAYADIPAEAEADTPIRFVASTEQVARDGYIVDVAGWRLDNYRRNPVFLWAHDYGSPPIGRADVLVDGDRLVADVTFDRDDPFAQSIERKYRNGFLKAVSVGFNPMKFAAPERQGDAPHITESELLDISAVPVPSDPRALKERTLSALSEIVDDLEAETDAGPTWEQTAIEMMSLFDPEADTTDKERRRAYNRIERIYRKAGKTAPEFLPLDELDGLEADQISGLFLEHETDLLPGWVKPQQVNRVGAVLSTRNKADLKEAQRLIQSVLDRAETVEEDKDDEDENKRDALSKILAKLTEK